MDIREACKLSIITINYNGLNDTCGLIDTLPLGDESLEVIVVDNASKEDEASVIEQRYPKVRVVRSDRNLGFAGGNNLGIKAARGKYLFFINNDTLLYIGNENYATLRTLIKRLETSEKIGIVCPKIRFTWGDNPIQYVGYTPLSKVTLRNRSIGFGETDRGQFDTAHPTPYAHGAAMMVRREAIQQGGLMPECYFLYYEELDWSLMIRHAGYEIWVEPSATVYHKESQSTGQHSPLRTFYITRNRLLFVSRNVSRPLRYVSYLYLIGAVAVKDCLKYIIQRRPQLVGATVRGVLNFIKQSAQ